MSKDISIIFRSNKETKNKITAILKRNNLTLSSLLNAYMLDTIQKDMVPINIRSKMRVYTKNKVSIPEIKKILTKIIEKNYKGRIDKAYLFGSYSRGEEGEDSDIDILIEAKRENFNILDASDLKNMLQIEIGKPIDISQKRSCKEDFLANILKDEICIYEQCR